MSDISIVESMLCVTAKGPRKTYIYQSDDDLASAISGGFLLSDHQEVTIKRVAVFGADSDEVAHLYRHDVARDSGMMSPTVPG